MYIMCFDMYVMCFDMYITCFICLVMFQSTHPKVKLLKRSHALRDDASPPPDELTIAETKIITATPTVTVSQTLTINSR